MLSQTYQYLIFTCFKNWNTAMKVVWQITHQKHKCTSHMICGILYVKGRCDGLFRADPVEYIPSAAFCMEVALFLPLL